MTIYESIVRYQNALEEIQKYFGNTSYPPPELMLDVYWRINEGTISWDYNDINFDEKEATYSEEIYRKCINRGKEYTQVFIYGSCGDKYTVLLDNSKER